MDTFESLNAGTPSPDAMKTTGAVNAGRPLIMGIVNVTPDSFSDGGRHVAPGDAIRHAYQLIEEGADIIDVGGESTRPTHTPVSYEEEWARLRPVLEELCRNSPVPISVDTYKARVASHAIELGVEYVNDVWGGLADADMLRIVADSQCTYIWMHNRRSPPEKNVFEALMEETRFGLHACTHAGIADNRIWIDPGIGFGKTYPQNLTVLKRLREYCEVGYPVLLGTSRKSVIGNTLGLPPEDRLEGSLATAVLGVQAGATCLRVHDVQATVRACTMTKAILSADD